MIELKKEELMKNRGYSATLSAGYHLLADNFKAIFRHTWVYVLLLSICLAAYTSLSVELKEDTLITIIIAAFITMLASLVTDVLFYSRVTTLLNDQSERWNIGRISKLLGVWILLAIIIGLVIVGVFVMGMGSADALSAAANEEEMMAQPDNGTLLLKTLAVGTAICLLALVLVFPFVYTIMKYLIEPERRLFSTLFGCYGRGLRYWGYIFVCELLLCLCIGIFSLILCLPMYLVQTVQALDQSGIIGGDESGLPGWFGWLNFGVSVATYFVYSFISLIEFFVAYYIYGSIETRISERLQLTAPEEL